MYYLIFVFLLDSGHFELRPHEKPFATFEDCRSEQITISNAIRSVRPVFRLPQIECVRIGAFD
jgi:hypothetical protein